MVKGDILTCNRCKRTWTQRGDNPPINCPNCKSPRWNKPRVRDPVTHEWLIDRKTGEKLDK